MMCDDIYLSDGRKGKWGSQETQRALQAFTEAKIISTQYVLKSVLPQKNFNSKVQKHLAVCKLLWVIAGNWDKTRRVNFSPSSAGYRIIAGV